MAVERAEHHRGKANYLNGLSAEDAVARRYEDEGGLIEKRRWRGASGEIDLIVRHGGELIFVEVKRAQHFARAAERITATQMRRIYKAASEYITREPKGLLTPVRFDVALVNGLGETDILQNVSLYVGR